MTTPAAGAGATEPAATTTPVAGGAGAGAGGGAGGAAATQTQAAASFSQDDVSRIAAREKEEGKRAAERELAEKLGVTVDEAADIIKAHREKQDAEKSEAQRARDAADREKAEAASEKAAAAKERHAAKVERALLAAGVNATKPIEKVAALVTVELGADDDKVKEAVAATLKEFPELFGQPAAAATTTTTTGTTTAAAPVQNSSQLHNGAPTPAAPTAPAAVATTAAPNGDPTGGAPAPVAGQDAFARGKERAKTGARSKYEFPSQRTA